ncbi:MAG: metal ABC transporter permease [Candidatus Bathyarchaeia archaeon]
MPDPFTLILTHQLLQRAILASILTAVISATAGTFTVLRGLSFLASAVAHAALGGAALAIFLHSTGLASGFNPALGALLFSLVVAAVTGYAGERGVTSRMEVAVGVTFAMAMSIAVFFMYYIPAEYTPQIWGYLIGDIYLLTVSDFTLLFVATIMMAILTILLLKEFTYLSFDMEGLTAHGLDARLYHYLLVTASSLAIAVATKAVGAILVYAIMVAPAAAASEWGKTVSSISVWAFTIALTMQTVGLVSSLLWNTSPSAVAGILVALTYLGTILVRKKTV